MPGACDRQIAVTVGRLDAGAWRAYHGGQCLALAIALNELTHWPIVWLGRSSCDGVTVACADHDDSAVCPCQVGHAGVRTPEGGFLDIDGPRSSVPTERSQTSGRASRALVAAILRDPDWPAQDVGAARHFAAALLAELRAGVPADSRAGAVSAWAER